MRRFPAAASGRSPAGNVRARALLPAACCVLAGLAGCMEKTDADFRAEVTAAMHTAMTQNLADIVQAARELQATAPLHGWNVVSDAAAIAKMRDTWKRMRVSWEQVEGAVAPMFPKFDTAMDSRYEDLLDATGPDPYLFDASGVIGMHAIERILFAPVTRPEVVTYERGLTGYKQSAYPATDNEAIAFKTQLVQRLIDDATELQSRWQPGDVDIVTCYQGMVRLMNEQQDKVQLAATGAEESRYSNITLADLRNNLTGTHQAYDLFRDWIHSKSSAVSSDQMVQDQFSSLHNAYAVTPGESLPAAPPGWDPSDPSDSDFGKLWQQVHDSVDPDSQGSVVFEMSRIAELLGFTTASGLTEPPKLRLRLIQ
ncbi:MAG TPA: imelysin family protein [Kofleriaceae bacterium]|nr:imelysin family protein [Kofleriaceae bacterium]